MVVNKSIELSAAKEFATHNWGRRRQVIARQLCCAGFYRHRVVSTSAAAAVLLGSTALLVSSETGLAQAQRCSLVLASAAEQQQQVAARMISVIGNVTLEKSGDRLRPHQRLCVGDVISVGSASRAVLRFENAETWVKLGENSRTVIEAPDENQSSIEILEGVFYFFSRVRQSLSIKTPYANAGINGTEFLVEVDQGQPGTAITVYEGAVGVNGERVRELTSGDRIEINNEGDERLVGAPADPYQPLTIDAPGRMAWTLYYPPLIDANADNAVGQAAHALASGDTISAKKLLSLEDSAEALALSSVIALAQLELDDAKRLLEQARERAPDSPAVLLADGYLLQAKGDIPAALTASRTALDREPDNRTARARVAELLLASGDIDNARQLASALDQESPSAAALTLLGFSELLSRHHVASKNLFARAIQIDGNYPLARLGLGLAFIRNGDIEMGRRQLELAVLLDPISALYRSYLGEAYASEDRHGRARTQFDMAISLDEEDPTPFLFRGLLSAQDRRYVQALEDIERSIELNDNRSVTRSNRLLDTDAAQRSANIGQIYSALGFEKSATNAALRGLRRDPTSSAAHRLLSESYAKRERHEVARVSELFQAQIMGDLDAELVRPGLQITDFNIIGSTTPFQPGLGEYGRLFGQDGISGSISAIGGNQKTFGEEVVITGRSGSWIIGVGQTHVETDGFHKNNDVENDVVTLFGQWHANTETSLTLDYRNRETERGDIDLLFDTQDHSDTERTIIDQQSIRLAGKFRPTPISQLVVAGTLFERDETQDSSEGGAFPTTNNSLASDDGYQIESRADFAQDNLNLIVGAGYHKAQNFSDVNATIDFGGGPVPFLDTVNSEETEQRNIYGMALYELLPGLTVEGGLGVEQYRRGINRQTDVAYRGGITWRANNYLTARAAAFRTVARPLANNQTIEPTQIAGFNRFYDDANGSVADFIGLGLDIDMAPGTKLGLETAFRDVTEPRVNQGPPQNIQFDDYDEYFAAAHLNMTITDDWTLHTGASLDIFESADNAEATIPDHLRTFVLPLGIGYRNSDGWYAAVNADLVFQEQESQDAGGTPAEGSNSFVYATARAGYEFGQRANLALEVRNFLDQEFDFRDNNFRQAEQRRSRYQPETTILLTGTLRF